VRSIRGPTHEQRAILLISQNLEHPRHCARLRDADEQTTIEKADLVHGHIGGTTPICPVRFLVFVIIAGSQIGCCMDETQDEALGGPIYDNINSHVVLVKGDLVGLGPLDSGTVIAECFPNLGETGKTDTGVFLNFYLKFREEGEINEEIPRYRAMQSSALQHTSEVLAC